MLSPSPRVGQWTDSKIWNIFLKVFLFSWKHPVCEGWTVAFSHEAGWVPYLPALTAGWQTPDVELLGQSLVHLKRAVLADVWLSFRQFSREVRGLEMQGRGAGQRLVDTSFLSVSGRLDDVELDGVCSGHGRSCGLVRRLPAGAHAQCAMGPGRQDRVGTDVWTSHPPFS